MVGFTVRRGDFCGSRAVLSTQDLVNNFDYLRTKYHEHLKIVITSDEIQNVEKETSNTKCCHFIKNKTPAEQIVILSFCDYVISNGAYYRCEDEQVKGYESTFGQIA